MTDIFSDDFESGNLNTWTSSTGSPSVQSTTKYQGSYAMQASFSGQNYATKTFSGQSLVYHRAYIRFSAVPTTSGTFGSLGNLRGTDFICWLQLYNDSGVVKWRFCTTNNGVEELVLVSSPTPTVDTWYCIEYAVKIDGTTGEYHLWIDGVERVSLTGKDTNNYGNVTSINDGATYSSGFTSGNLFVDCVVVADSYIGPLSASTFTITASADSHSTISPSGAVNVNSGANQAFSMSADSGYHITHVYVDSVDQGAISSYTFYNVTANHTISVESAIDTGDLVVSGTLTVNGTIYNRSYYNLIDNNGSTWINALLVANTSPSTDLHFVPNYSTQSGGISKVYFGYNSNWGSYNWMNGTTTLMSLNSNGQLQLPATGSSGGLVIGGDTNLYRSGENLLKTDDSLIMVPGSRLGHAAGGTYGPDDGLSFSNQYGALVFWFHPWDANPWFSWRSAFDSSELMRLNVAGQLQLPTTGSSGGLAIGSGIQVSNDAANLPYTYVALPTQTDQQYSQYHAYTDLGHGNILFHHTGNEHTPYLAGTNASLFLVMIQDPTGNYNPFIATDEGLFVEKDIQTYGALFTQSDPSKNPVTGGGAVVIGHGFYGSAGFPPCIVLPDAGFSTLHLLTNVTNMTPGHLSLGALIAQANVKIGIFSDTADRGPLYASYNGYIGYAQSTIRVKENVQDLPDCSWLYNLRPVTFTWKDPERAKQGRHMGLIAEEVSEQCPQLTWLDKEGKPEGVHYEWLGVPLLVELKKLKTEVHDLRSQLQKLTARGGVSA